MRSGAHRERHGTGTATQFCLTRLVSKSRETARKSETVDAPLTILTARQPDRQAAHSTAQRHSLAAHLVDAFSPFPCSPSPFCPSFSPSYTLILSLCFDFPFAARPPRPPHTHQQILSLAGPYKGSLFLSTRNHLHHHLFISLPSCLTFPCCFIPLSFLAHLTSTFFDRTLISRTA